MAGNISITITGDIAIMAKLRAFGPAVQGILKSEFETAGDQIVDYATTICPVDTGFLRDNIEVDEFSERGVTVVSNADYSAYQDIDFMGDAIDTVMPTMMNAIKTSIWQAWKFG